MSIIVSSTTIYLCERLLDSVSTTRITEPGAVATALKICNPQRPGPSSLIVQHQWV